MKNNFCGILQPDGQVVFIDGDNILNRKQQRIDFKDDYARFYCCLKVQGSNCYRSDPLDENLWDVAVSLIRPGDWYEKNKNAFDLKIRQALKKYIEDIPKGMAAYDSIESLEKNKAIVASEKTRVVLGDGGIVFAGDYSDVKTGNVGLSWVGMYGHAVSGDAGLAVAGDEGVAVTGRQGESIGKDSSTAKSGINGKSRTGKAGKSITGDRGIATAGETLKTTPGDRNIVSAGEFGILNIYYWCGQTQRLRLATAYVGENGIEPNVEYTLDNNNQFVKFEK